MGNLIYLESVEMILPMQIFDSCNSTAINYDLSYAVPISSAAGLKGRSQGLYQCAIMIRVGGHITNLFDCLNDL